MTATESPFSTWFIVSQVKSNRIVYFTDDADYAPPMQGDWYYVSPYQGALPKGISLRNCWRWRFDGHAFVDASEPAGKPQEVILLDSNKAALLKLLHDKIDALRKPYAPSSLLGEEVRAAKLSEAQALLAGTLTSLQGGYLLDAAAAANCTVQDMAQRIVKNDADRLAMLGKTESVRVHLQAALTAASTQTELIALRQRIMSDMATGLNTPIKPDHTTERKLNAKPSAQELQQEQVRLSVQLRERINDLRRPYLSQYLLDDVVLKHKGQVAQVVLTNGGAIPVGLDGIVLISHAAARGQTLLGAANEVLTEMNDTAQALLATEQIKDAWSARIAGVQTFKEIEDLGRAIDALKLPQLQSSKNDRGMIK